MKGGRRIRIEKPAYRENSRERLERLDAEILSLDPRDPDVVRAKSKS